jgi:hypothetical protein
MTPREKIEKRRDWWIARWQHLKLWFYCAIAVGFALLVPDLTNGIANVKVLMPNWTQVAIILALAFFAILLDEEKGGDKSSMNPKVYFRKRKHAIMTGLAIMALIERIWGS